jgi:hypothetical protein
VGDVQQQARLELEHALEFGQQLVTGRIFDLARFDGGQVGLGESHAVTDFVQGQAQLFAFLSNDLS